MPRMWSITLDEFLSYDDLPSLPCGSNYHDWEDYDNDQGNLIA